MRKIKLCKRIIAFLLVLTLVLSGNTQFVFADTNINGQESAAGYTDFSANMFDYDRDVINSLVVNSVADAIQNDIDAGVIDGAILEDKAELRKRYPAMIFIDVSRPGVASANYTYTDEESGEEKVGVVKAVDYKPVSYAEGNCLFNRNNSFKREGTTYQGLVRDKLSDNKLPVFNVANTDLFNVSNTSNKTVYTNIQVPFTNTADGYYIFDSCKNKYKIQNGRMNIIESDDSKTGQGYGYVPFDCDENGKENYHFGMNLSVDFMMPEDGKYNGEDCVFKFSGDDDVWVYLDGKLALELGGMHAVANGSINFAQQKVIYENTTYKDNTYNQTSRTESFESLGISVNDNETHTMNVFYLERGAYESNCKIKFNMPTINTNEDIKGDFSFEKKDSVTNQNLADAEFTLYSDEAMSQVVGSPVLSDQNGKVTFTDLTTGEYYIKETRVPDGYKDSTAKKYKLIVAGNTSDLLTFTLLDLATNVEVTDKNEAGEYIIYNIPVDNHIEIDKTSKLNDWQNRTYEVTLKADAYKPSREGETLSTDANASSNQIMYGTVIDIVDSRFELTDASKSFLQADGATIVYNSNETTTITWENQSLLGWERKFEIKARELYVGGNNVPTNDPNSRVIILDGDRTIEKKFPEPKVNVRIELTAGVARDEIFLGQSMERYFNDNQLKLMFDYSRDVKYFRDINTDRLVYSWDVDGRDRPVEGTLVEFTNYVKSLSPRVSSDTVPFKQLYISLTPLYVDASDEAKAAAKSMKKETDDPDYTACMSDADDTTITNVTATGKYYVTIIDGSIVVDKKYDHSFLTDLIYSNDEIEAIDARQTAAFTIYKYAEDASVEAIANGTAEVLDTYSITITGEGNQKIVGLEAGMYKVEENTNWTWKYNATVQEANDSTTDGIFYIGKQSPNASVVNSETVSFENKLDRELSKIYSDTTNILNSFIGN